MRVVALLLLLVCGAAWADPPADAPLADVSGTSARVVQGQIVPFTGYLVSDAETERRGKSKANCEGTLSDAQTNGVLLPKAAVATMISAGAVAVITSIALGVALATKK